MAVKHAVLSASSSERWLNCPPSARLCEAYEDKSSNYAAEGTDAHALCEFRLKQALGIPADNPIENLSWYNEEMEDCAAGYAAYVSELLETAKQTCADPVILIEQRVDFSRWVQDGFGTADCIVIADGVLNIVDYKHGKGVPVSPEENPQLMLYALGALKLYKPLFGGAIKKVAIVIDQPRLNSYEMWTCATEELLAWGESIKPKAQAAFMGFGEYHAGDWCRFCRANGICKAQAEQQTSAFDDFAGAVGNPQAILTPEEISAVLERGKNLAEWFKTVQEKALEMMLNGDKIPGYKVVEGRSQRAWTDQDKALEKLQSSGIERAVIYDSVPKTLAQLEKLLGKAKFDELVSEFVFKPQGKPTLALADDPRKEFNSAAADFAGVTNGS